jgi:hypothetical protein
MRVKCGIFSSDIKEKSMNEHYPTAQDIVDASNEIKRQAAEIENLKAYAKHERSLGAEPWAIECNDLQQKIERKDSALKVALEWIESNPAPRRLGSHNAITQINKALK